MLNRNKLVIKSGIWYVISDFLVRGIEAIMIPLYTRFLTKAEYGNYNNFLSWLQIINVIITLSLQSTLIRAKYDYKERLDEYICSMMALEGVLYIFAAIVINTFQAPFMQIFGMKMSYINGIFIYVILYLAISLFLTRERLFFRYKNSVMVSMGNIVFRVILTLSMFWVLPDKLDATVIGRIFPSIVIGSILTVNFFHKGKSIDIHMWKYALPIALPYVPHLLSLVVLSSVDRIMIKNMCGSEETALYSLAYNCGLMITVLLNSVNAAFAPWLGEKIHLREFNSIRQVSRQYVLLFMCGALFIILLAPEVLLVLGGKSYAESIYVFLPVALGCVYQFFYTLFVNIEQFEKKTVGMAVGSISAAGFNYFLNLYLVPRFGYIAAAYTTLVSYLWLLIVHMFIVWKIGFSKVYNYRFIGFCVVTMAVLSICINWLYHFSEAVRIIVCMVYISILGIAFLKYRNKNKGRGRMK